MRSRTKELQKGDVENRGAKDKWDQEKEERRRWGNMGDQEKKHTEK